MNYSKEIGVVGLGKMGKNLALQLLEKGWKVFGYNRSPHVTKELAKKGLIETFSLEALVERLSTPRIVWIMVPSGTPVQETIFKNNGLLKFLEKDDVLIDGGNSFYKNTIERAKEVERKGIHFLDVGVSGGPSGARSGACMMVGGNKNTFNHIEMLFRDTCTNNGYGYMGKSGAGHFVKMVHNGIEYGMMQAIAEGFDIMKSTQEFDLNLAEVAKVYNNGSVIESRLMGWMQEGFKKYGINLDSVSGAAIHSGEGKWTVETANELNVPVKVVEKALNARENSRQNPNYQGKIIMTLRNMFGGHSIK